MDFRKINWSSLLILLLSLIVPTTVFILFLIALFPGNMTVDSVEQWQQIITYKFNDWHPVMHTVFNLVMSKIWNSPAMVVLAQIVIMVAVYFWGIKTMERLGVSKIILAIAILFFSFYPANGFMIVTLWKDILYSIMLMWMTIILVNVVFTKGKWIESKVNLVIFCINSLGVMFFRHNGILTFLAVVAVLCIFYIKNIRSWAILGISVFAIYFAVTGPIFNLMGVTRGVSTEAMGIPMQMVAAVIQKDGVMTQEQKDYFFKVLPEGVWKEKYHPYITNPLKFDKSFNYRVLVNNKGELIKKWLEVVKQNPEITTEAYLKHTSMIWRIYPMKDSFTYTTTPGIIDNDIGLKQTIISEKLTNNILELFHYSKDNDTNLVRFWRPAVWLYLSILAGIIIAFKLGYKSLILLVPLLSNSAAFMIATPSSDYRYQYANLLIALVLLPLSTISKKKGYASEAQEIK